MLEIAERAEGGEHTAQERTLFDQLEQVCKVTYVKKAPRQAEGAV